MNTKSVLLIIAIFYISEFPNLVSSEFNVEQVSGLGGHIKSINCGSNDYCFVVEFTSVNGSKFHKISAEKKILTSDQFKKIVAVTLNDENTAYLFESDAEVKERDESELWYILYIKKDGWNNFTIMYQWKMDDKTKLKILLDKNNYLFATMEHGPVVFKPDRNVPIALYTNSEMLNFNSFVSDSRGNIYFQTGKSEDQFGSVFRIAKEGTDMKIPQAERIINIGPDDETEITSMGMSSNGGVFFATSNFDTKPPTANITKLKGSQLQVILSQFETKYHFICTTKDRLYFLTITTHKNISTDEDIFLNFIDSEDEVTAIQPDLEGKLIAKDKCQEDSDGNVFFPSDKSILKIEKGQTTIIEITTGSDREISSLLIDQSNNLWALGEKLYFIKRGSVKPESVVLDIGIEALFEENKRQAEVLVGTKNGLWAVSEKKV